MDEYTDFNYKNGHFGCDDFFCSSKDIRGGNSHIWYNNYSLPSTKVLGFVACRFTSKILGTGDAELSWCYFKTIKSVNRSAIISDVSEKHSIFIHLRVLNPEGLHKVNWGLILT